MMIIMLLIIIMIVRIMLVITTTTITVVIVIVIILVMMMMMMIMTIVIVIVIVIIMIIHYSTLDLLGIEFHYFSMYDTSNLMTQVMSLKDWCDSLFSFIFFSYCIFWIHRSTLIFLNKKDIVVFIIFFISG